ncbi:MAG TPA: response regulator [Prolixibacteraceae bacterium]|nr:response regulator [Prolixibacteraceae bacterium]
MKLKTKILVIEDDIRLAKTIRNVLVLQDYDVCVVTNGASGIQKAFEYNPNLILCDIKMDPVDGYQVYNVLKESSIIDTVPFIFITGSSDVQEIRFGMDLGADDYFVKPFNNDDLVLAIEKRLSKFKKLTEIGKREFKALFKLSPNGIFLFDGEVLYDANPALVKTLELNPDRITSYTINDIVNPLSFITIKEKIRRCSNGLLNTFSENVTLQAQSGIETEVTLYVSVYEKYSSYSLMIGFLAMNSNLKGPESDVFISDILSILKKENVSVTDSLGEKLIDVFKRQNLSIRKQNTDFFSERENQVLSLSMEGLSIKMIADKLSISDRTVEKHRSSLMGKTNSNNMIEVIVFSLRNNLLEI